jgi:hypothetical protein
MTALVLFFALLLVVVAVLWLIPRGRTSWVSETVEYQRPSRLKRLWWPGIVTRPA